MQISSKYKVHFIFIILLVMLVFSGCKSKQPAVAISPQNDSQITAKSEGSRFTQNQQMSIDNAFLEGVKRMMIEDYGTALDVFFDVLKMDNQHAAANFQISRIRLLQNQLNDAEIHAERAWRLSQDNKFYIEHLASIYRHNHKFPQALNSYQQLIELDPKNEDEYRLEMAELYLLLRRPAEALRILDQIEKKRGVSEELSMQKIRIYQILGQENNMRNELQKLIREFPNMPAYWAILAELNLQTGRLAEASENLQKILSLEPENPMILIMYADFLRQTDRFDEACEYYRKVVEIDPSQYLVWEAVLFCNMNSLDSPEFIADAQKALELFPEQPLPYYILGIGYNYNKDYEMAMQYFEQAVPLAQSNAILSASIYGALGDVYHQLENYKKSDDNYRKALKIEPNDDLVLNNFSYYLSLRKENLDEAERMSRSVVQRNPNNPTYLDTFAWVLYQQGKYAEAKAVMELALKNGGDDQAILLEHYGDILYKTNEKELALEYWKKAQNLDDSSVSEFLNEKINTQTLIEN
ncbi:MAG: tetratricopeptide repeat protein [Bacteroidales bacterium]|nr:tetratricopeptide repeat protein [Bacteroidales bacterium]